jgi:uncharacterized protein
MKLLLLLMVVLVGAWWWRQKSRAKTPPAKSTAQASTERMVNCARCGLHLPQTDAIAADGVFFCSTEHQLRSGA